MESIRGFLQALGLPYEWVTNFVVRKCAHFTDLHGAWHLGDARL